jgi:glycosyltransferase involved in cell wall biosynthesis
MVLVSILIPCYNAAPHLEEAIMSAISQTVGDKEIIIFDDGSTDESRSIAQRIADKQEIKVISNRVNVGQSAAREALFAAAEGDWIQYLDADDILLPTKIEDQLSSGLEADIYASTYGFIDDDNEKSSFSTDLPEYFIDFLGSGRKWQPNSLLLKSQTLKNLKDHQGYIWKSENLISATSTELYLDLMGLDEPPKMVFLPVLGGYYRRDWSQDQSSKNKSQEQIQASLERLQAAQSNVKYELASLWYRLCSLGERFNNLTIREVEEAYSRITEERAATVPNQSQPVELGNRRDRPTGRPQERPHSNRPSLSTVSIKDQVFQELSQYN